MAARAEKRVQSLVAHLTAAGSSSSDSNAFKYSLDPKHVLTPEQRRQYDEDGYLLVRKIVSEAEIAVWRDRFIAIANGDIPPTPTMLVMRDVAIAKRKEKGEKAITKLQDWQDDEVLFSYTSHPQVAKYVEAIIGPSFKSVHTMLINKPPDVGVGSSRHPPHQDLWYFPFRDGKSVPGHETADTIVASWTAMQTINKANGCLFVQPGSHKRGQLLKHTYPNDGVVNKAYHGIHNLTEKDTASMLHVEMEPGDTLFFHPLLIHGSGRNLSSGYRKAISCHYASTSCIYTEMEGTLQEELAKEIEEMAKRKGAAVSFNDIWRAKSRLIQGKEDTL